MSAEQDAAKLEALLPKVMTVIFRSTEEDPLRHSSVGQVRLMRALLSGRQTASELGHKLGLSPSSLTQMVGRMIAAGLVSKELDPNDRRVRMLSLTPNGLALMQRRQDMRAKAASRLIAKMDPARLEELMTILTEMLELESDESYALLEAVV